MQRVETGQIRTSARQNWHVVADCCATAKLWSERRACAENSHGAASEVVEEPAETRDERRPDATARGGGDVSLKEPQHLRQTPGHPHTQISSQGPKAHSSLRLTAVQSRRHSVVVLDQGRVLTCASEGRLRHRGNVVAARRVAFTPLQRDIHGVNGVVVRLPKTTQRTNGTPTRRTVGTEKQPSTSRPRSAKCERYWERMPRLLP